MAVQAGAGRASRDPAIATAYALAPRSQSQREGRLRQQERPSRSHPLDRRPGSAEDEASGGQHAIVSLLSAGARAGGHGRIGSPEYGPRAVDQLGGVLRDGQRPSMDLQRADRRALRCSDSVRRGRWLSADDLHRLVVVQSLENSLGEYCQTGGSTYDFMVTDDVLVTCPSVSTYTFSGVIFDEFASDGTSVWTMSAECFDPNDRNLPAYRGIPNVLL